MYTLVWIEEAGAYKLRLWEWQIAGLEAKRGMWDALYRNGTGFDRWPNHLLEGVISKTRPGEALDLAMEQGRNALLLAKHGWKVTGVDISDEALQEARAVAAEQHVTLDAYDFGVGKWDLVTMIYTTDKPQWIENHQVHIAP